jgi:hypothetical protein
VHLFDLLAANSMFINDASIEIHQDVNAKKTLKHRYYQRKIHCHRERESIPRKEAAMRRAKRRDEL